MTEQKGRRFNEKTVAKYIQQLLKAINHCHAQDIIHRDVKPENIMVTENDEIKLIDFGLSIIQETQYLKDVHGTPLYMAPEVM